jgi:hypothetical protein
VKELQSLTLGVELVRDPASGEIDAESLLTHETDVEVNELGTDRLIRGEEAVADMPLVDLAGGQEDQLQAEAETKAQPVTAGEEA